MIPKIIHYCWFGNNPIPDNLKKYMKTWSEKCPDYQIIRWDESNLDVDAHPFSRAAYEAGAWAFVSDYARLKVVFDNGGIYLDTDIELLKSFDSLLDYHCFIGVQQLGSYVTTGLGYGAVKGHPVVGKMLERYDETSFSMEHLQEIACPFLNASVFRELGYTPSDVPMELNGKVLVLPSQYLDPLSPGDTKNLLCDDTISIHHYAASWSGSMSRWKRSLSRVIGQDHVNRLKKFLRR